MVDFERKLCYYNIVQEDADSLGGNMKKELIKTLGKRLLFNLVVFIGGLWLIVIVRLVTEVMLWIN